MTYSLVFDRPQYLVLLAIIPLLAWIGRRSLSVLGPRRRLAILLRSLVAAAFIFALADVQFRKTGDGLTVVYLLDQSLSIPAPQREAMLGYVRASTDKYRKEGRNDRFAVIVFGRDAQIEIPPVAYNDAVGRRLESRVDGEFSDLASAIQRASAIFPAGAAKRMVLVSDGNQNLGDALRQARAAANQGVSIDVVPVYLASRGDVAIEKLDVPSGVRVGEPFNIRVVLENTVGEQVSPSSSSTPPQTPQTVKGRLLVTRKFADGESAVIADRDVELDPGKQVFSLQQKLDDADFYSYEATFTPADPAADASSQNNFASGFTALRGRARMLLVENPAGGGQASELAERLRRHDISVTQQTSDQAFASLADLQRYDAVVLDNVARSSADAGDRTALVSDAQIEMLVRNTRELGCGLVMLGGPDTFGAGGWANTPLEDAMPVDFKIKAAKVVPVGALSIVIDQSGSMEGDKLVLSRLAAIAAVKTMGPRDYINVVAFDSAAYDTFPLQRVGDGRAAAAKIGEIASAGGTNLYPAMQKAFEQLKGATDASVKHMIVLTDGQTPAAPFAELVSEMRKENITVTGVAVGADANSELLAGIARDGGGKFYAARTPQSLPRIFIREVRRVARPLVFESSTPLDPIVESPSHPILSGVKEIPPVTGFVLTTLKKNPLVERVLRSPQPPRADNATLLAAWTFGAGRTAALTTDIGRRWAKDWPPWSDYDKFLTQLVRWAMRPSDGAENYSVAIDLRDGVAKLVVTAMDEEDQFLNNRPITAAAVSPKLKSISIDVEQTAPGRYEGSFAAEETGSYLVVVNPGPGEVPVRTGVNVGYSPEFRDRQTNVPLLESIADLTADHGPRGEFAKQGLDAVLTAGAENSSPGPDPFRRDLPRATSQQSIWPWMVVAGACLFWGDVFVRRVQINWEWVFSPLVRAWNFISGGAHAGADATATIGRLKSRKQEVGEQIAGRRGALPLESMEHSSPASRTKPSAAELSQIQPSELELPSTERLLETKRRLRKKMD